MSLLFLKVVVLYFVVVSLVFGSDPHSYNLQNSHIALSNRI